MRTVLSLGLMLLMATVVLAQPPRMEWKGKVKDLGDPERLEKPQQSDRQHIERERGPWAMPGEFRQHVPGWGPGKNKYGGPLNDGMKNWGGTPFRDFGPGRPWGGMGGPPNPFRPEMFGHNFSNRGRGWEFKHSGRNFEKSFKSEKFRGFNENCPRQKERVCPFCGVTMG